MAKVLVTSIYSFDSIMLAATKLGIDKLILMIDKNPDDHQKKAVEMVEKSLGKVVDIIKNKIDVYDIVSVASDMVNVLDSIGKEDQVYVNITPSRKTQALGLLFGSYARASKVKKIIYMKEEDKSIITLPKLDYNLTDAQKEILEKIRDNNFKSMAELSSNVKISKGMLYRSIKNLINLGLVYEEEGINLTDAGRIAVL